MDVVIRRRGRLPVRAWAGFAAVVAVVWIDFLGERTIDESRARIHRAVALQQGIGFEVMDTGSACRTYNVLAAEDRNIAAALMISS